MYLVSKIVLTICDNFLSAMSRARASNDLNCLPFFSCDGEKRLKAENLQKTVRSREQFIRTMKGQKKFQNRMVFFNILLEVSQI